MKPFKTSRIVTRTFGATAILAVLALSATVSAKGQRVGSTYTPDGSDFTITALEGIDSSNPLGTTGSAQVDLNFEFDPSIGVAYDKGDGHLQDFGLGLYEVDKTHQVESTGLSIQYHNLVNANSANLTLEDFDLHAGATGFKPEKVAAAVLVYGANNKLLLSATAAQVFGAMVAEAGQDDMWDLNIGKLLAQANVKANGVSRVVLYADASNGQKGHSDPYQLKSVGKTQPVPEPATFCALGAGLLLLRRRKAKSQA